MEIYETDFDDDSSNFDDRLEIDSDYLPEMEEESKPLKDDDLFYRHLEEY